MALLPPLAAVGNDHCMQMCGCARKSKAQPMLCLSHVSSAAMAENQFSLLSLLMIALLFIASSVSVISGQSTGESGS